MNALLLRASSLLLAASAALLAQGQRPDSATASEAPAYAAQTATVDVSIPALKKAVRPLTREEVQAEAEAWMALLVAKNKQIAAADADATVALTLEQSGIVTRMAVVTEALTARGGDATKYDQYIAASTTPELADVGGMFDFAVEWAKNPEGGVQLAINFGLFLLTLLLFRVVSGLAARVVHQALRRMKGTSDLLRDFLSNVTRRVVFFLGLVVALSVLGVNITPFLAALGAAGFVIGFALQGTLSNFASGMMILIYRPYDLGEVVTVAGTTGTVAAMTLVSTTLKLPDNTRVVIPNNSIWGDVITNVTGQTTRRVDMVFGCGYGDDLQTAQRVLEDIVTQHPKVHAEPAPVVKVHALADSSVNFIVRPWTATGDYWEVYWDVTRQVKERFDAEGLSIPYPQQDVHVHQVTGGEA
jgi:small conductance mechanosensitive channel